MEEELLISSTSQSLKCNYTLLVALGRRAHTLLSIAQPKQLISSASFSLSEICLATRMIIVIILFKIFYSFWFFSARGSHTMLQCSPYKLMFVAVCWAHSLSYFLFDCNGSGTVCAYFFLRLFSLFNLHEILMERASLRSLRGIANVQFFSVSVRGKANQK